MGGELLSRHAAFFAKNESFRGALRSDCDARLQHAYESVDMRARDLCAAVAADFPSGASSAVHDVLNNRLVVTSRTAATATATATKAAAKTKSDATCNVKAAASADAEDVEPPPGGSAHLASMFAPALDRNRRPMPRHSSTTSVEIAVDRYVEQCALTSRLVSDILKQLSATLEVSFFLCTVTSRYLPSLEVLEVHCM